MIAEVVTCDTSVSSLPVHVRFVGCYRVTLYRNTMDERRTSVVPEYGDLLTFGNFTKIVYIVCWGSRVHDVASPGTSVDVLTSESKL